MVGDLIEQRIFELIKPWNGRSWLTFKMPTMTRETSLNHSMRMDPEEAAELLQEIFNEFEMDFNKMNFERYFSTSKSKEKPLTIDMLMKSAEAGYWLFD